MGLFGQYLADAKMLTNIWRTANMLKKTIEDHNLMLSDIAGVLGHYDKSLGRLLNKQAATESQLKSVQDSLTALDDSLVEAWARLDNDWVDGLTEAEIAAEPGGRAVKEFIDSGGDMPMYGAERPKIGSVWKPILEASTDKDRDQLKDVRCRVLGIDANIIIYRCMGPDGLSRLSTRLKDWADTMEAASDEDWINAAKVMQDGGKK